MNRFVGRRPSMGARWWVDFALLSAMGIVWAFGIPLMAAPDEPAHAIKAAAVSRGDLSVRAVSLRGPYLTIPRTDVRVPTAYAGLNQRFLCFGQGKTRSPAQCLTETPIGSDRSLTTVGTYVGAYQPTYYALVGWPSRLLPPEAALRAMRVISLLISAALLASGLASARTQARHRLLTVFSAVALTPMTIFLAASINPNGMEIAAAFCLWLTLLAVFRDVAPPPSRLLLRLVVAGSLLAAARPASPYIAIGVVLAVTILAADRSRLRALASDRRVLGAGVALIVAIAVSIVFVVVNHSATAVIEVAPATTSRMAQFRNGLDDTGRWLDELVGATGWIGLQHPRLPTWFVQAWLAVVSACAIAALRLATWRQRCVLVALVGAVLLGPPAALALTSTRYAWQGRYILPVAVGIPIVAAWLLDRHGSDRPRWSKLLTVILSVIVLGIGAGYTLAATRTVSFTILGQNRLRPVLHGPWPGPFSPLAFYVLVFVTSLAWCLRLVATLGSSGHSATVTSAPAGSDLGRGADPVR